jgi:hypothetical protein
VLSVTEETHVIFGMQGRHLERVAVNAAARPEHENALRSVSSEVCVAP